ncbi:MAG: tRNA pseudouridine(38-40) synthase TruA [Chitinivibrionales bacterium]|nr:tRNA pseudouridine(38-40) synthase TruA [Chitinivibrionales bacterium]
MKIQYSPHRYFFRVEYDGANYGGWQVQPNAPSIQELITRAFETVTRRPCSITGSGRTDAGVHARGQGAHIDFAEPVDTRAVQHSVNGILPRDIAIRELQEVSARLHARYSAGRRCYCYRIMTAKRPLWRTQAWQINYRVDWNLFRRMAQQIEGRHDFSAFCASGSDASSMLCTVARATLECQNEVYLFSIEADRFLYKMVRGLVGTLVDISRGKLTAAMAELLAAADRSRIGQIAPAHGLVLEEVTYPKELFDAYT